VDAGLEDAEAPMICPICRSGETEVGSAPFTYSNEGRVVVIRNVPGQVCRQCGEPYFGEDILDDLLSIARGALASGADVAICEFKERIPA
jgi:YgiT-type zinc finger domain-containing protein